MLTDIVLLNILHVLNDGFQASIVLLLPFISDNLYLNLTIVGILGSLITVLGIFLTIPAGYLATKIGGMKLLLGALIIYAAGFIITGLTPSLITVVIGFLLAGTGFALFHPVAFALVARLSSKESRGRTMGAFTAIGDVGRIGIAAGVTFFVVILGWEMTAIMYGAVAGILFVLLYIPHKKRTEHISETKKAHTNVPIKSLLTNKRYVLAVTATTFDNFASSTLFIFLPFLLLSKHLPVSLIGTLTSAYFIGNFMGKTVLGRLVDSMGNVKVFIAAETLMALCIILLTNAHSIIPIIVISIILGALTKGTAPVTQTLISDSVEHHGSYENAYGVNSVITNIATTVAPIVLGITSDKLGISVSFYVMASIAVLATVPAILYSFAGAHRA